MSLQVNIRNDPARAMKKKGTETDDRESAMDPAVREALFQAVEKEPFARQFDIQLRELEKGYSVVEMTYHPDRMNNIYERAHGGTIFGLIDEAFETACQTHGTIAVALNVNVTYVSSPEPGARLRATAKEIHRTKRTANYDIKVTDDQGLLVATCQALAFRTGKPIPFIPKEDRYDTRNT